MKTLQEQKEDLQKQLCEVDILLKEETQNKLKQKQAELELWLMTNGFTFNVDEVFHGVDGRLQICGTIGYKLNWAG